MSRKENRIQPLVGGSSLLVMVCVLCMTVFAMLSLSTVLAQRRLADAAGQSVADYYAADLQAEMIFARLRAGERVAGVEESEDVYDYTLPVSDRQTLHVTLERKDSHWHILRWQAVTAEGELADSLNVWQGAEGEEENP